MEISDSVLFSAIGGVTTIVSGAFGALWIRMGKIQDEKDEDRKEFTAKMEKIIIDQTVLLTKAAEQTNTFTRFMENLTSSTAQNQKELLDKLAGLALMWSPGRNSGQG